MESEWRVYFSWPNPESDLAEIQRATSFTAGSATEPLTAGLEEEADAQRNTVLFLRPELFRPQDLPALDDLTLTGLGIDLKRALAGMEEKGSRDRDLQVVLVTPDKVALLQERYSGWQIITVGRKPGSDPRPLALGALVAVLRDALEAGKPVFDVVVTHYLHLWDRTLGEALQELEAGISA